ncbi:K+ transport system, NAD-binding component [Dehalogenimonas alkenigignens]|uniref:Trk system potassium uptake protein TrkA n=1 Tax=Dehalogenimonas alkenigignens TaxID=1217799 RepID=A0A0W0GGQ4_9CHLR|nr:TrkA family potassium uptake protein [Dehalogenimonas alkenigignens]KTB47740.1 K+ transport system, NAD-binding component [Dehalogenimonas alkenigignens]
MYIIVAGGGRLGYSLTKALLNEGHELLLIEKNASVCDKINKELGSLCLRGDACETAIQTEAGTGRADMFIAVTGEDEDNLVACQVAKYRFNVPRTVARVRDPKNEDVFKKLGVDVTVNSTNIILERIEHEVPSHPMTHLFCISGDNRDFELLELRAAAGAAGLGRPMNELDLPAKAVLGLVIRGGGKPFVPRGDTVFMPGDQIIAVAPPETEADLRQLFAGR